MTVLLTEEHLRKIVEHHLLKEDEISDPVKLSRVVRKSLDAALGLPDLPWHDWDEWGRPRDRRFCAGLLYLRLGQYSI